MIRVAFTADNQYDERHRLDESIRVDDFMLRDSATREVDLWLHGGDVYERRSTAAERRAAKRFFSNMQCSAIAVSGNHEAPGEVKELDLMHTETAILYATERPDVFSVRGCAVACLPWPRKASLLSWLKDRGMDADVNATATEMLRDILRGFRAELTSHDGPRILLAHAMVRGSRQGPDQPPLVGTELELGLEDLALAGADVVLLGHVHMPQDWEVTSVGHSNHRPGTPVIYAGSPRRTAYAKGELEPKGYVYLEFGERRDDGTLPVTWDRIPTPATPMVLLEWEWDGNGFVGDRSFTLRDAEVRLRYTVDADQREAARAEAQSHATAWMAATQGAAEVKIEEVVRPTTSSRAPEIAKARGVPAKLAALWKAKEIEISEERRSRLFEMVGELEGEVQP